MFAGGGLVCLRDDDIGLLPVYHSIWILVNQCVVQTALFVALGLHLNIDSIYKRDGLF